MKTLLLVVVGFIVFSLLRAFANAMKAQSDARAGADPDENEEQRRVREIQERIRRIAAERSGQAAPMQLPPPMPAPVQPPPRAFSSPPPMRPIDPFGGPGGRILTTFERRVQQGASLPVPVNTRNAELERQELLQEEMRLLEEDKSLAARHRAFDAAERTEAEQSEAGLRATARARLLEDLRDPHGLRRAFVLREVLGAPVGLR